MFSKRTNTFYTHRHTYIFQINNVGSLNQADHNITDIRCLTHTNMRRILLSSITSVVVATRLNIIPMILDVGSPDALGNGVEPVGRKIDGELCTKSTRQSTTDYHTG